MPLLSIENGSFRYPGDDRWIFNGVNLDLHAGSVVKIEGRNGSGKSTLLKIIGGELNLTVGKLDKGDHFIGKYMDQFSGDMLNFEMTISEQLMSFPKDKARLENGLLTLAKFGLDLESRLNEFIGHLSGGQRQIIALLSVIGTGTPILCLDEFISALDDKSIDTASQLLKQVVEKHRLCVVLVSHSNPGLEIDNKVQL